MAKRGKRYNKAFSALEAEKQYELAEGCEAVCGTGSAKFDETVDLVMRLGVDPRKADQNVRGSVALPNGLGKDVRVIVFAKGEKVKEAEEAGADRVGGEELCKEVQEGFMDFDSVVATPDMMGQVGKLGKVLGPRGLMPSPKVGTVTFDVGAAVKGIKAGRAEFRVDKAGNVHTAVGKASFGGEKISSNVAAILTEINKMKPSTSKGVYLKSVALSCTMGPSVALDPSGLRNL